MDQSLKTGGTISCFILSAGIFHTHTVGSFFPGLPVSIFIASAVLYVTLYVNRSRLVYSVSAFTSLGILYRAYLFLSPASMIGFDPDAHAVRSQIIVQTGDLSRIVPGFYRDAPIFHILGSQTALITNMPIDNAYVIFPIIVGISMSVFAAVLAKRVTGSSQAAIAAAAIGAVSASTIKYSIQPGPMTLAAMYLAGCVMTIMLYRRDTGQRHLLILIFILIASAFTHKLPILLLVAILGILAIYFQFYSLLSRQKVSTYATSLLVLGTILLLFQWIYMTDFVTTAFRLTYETIPSVGPSSSTSQYELDAAVSVDPSLFVKIRNLSYYFVSTGFAAIVGIYLFSFANKRNVRVIQSAALGTVAITLPSVVLGTGPGFKRNFVFGSIFVAILIAVGAVNLSELPFPNIGKVSVAIVIVILLINPLSIVATPDFPGTHRTYFTQQEVEGKYFMNDQVPEEVFLDMYYGDEVFDFPRAAKGDDRHQRTVPNIKQNPTLMVEELIEGNLLEHNHSYIGLRNNVEVYRLRGGRYQLTWNPKEKVSQAYHRIYTNGGIDVYRNP